MNNDTNNASTDPHHQWLHYYQQTAAAMPSGGGTTTMHGFSDTTSTIVTTSVTTNNTTTSRPSKSSSASLISADDHAHPNPQTTKPIRRRSRAPRRTPTTLLNASTSNFRSLVQQFTGCQNIKSSSSISYGSQKGPVNLSFRNQNDHHQMIGTSSRIAPLGSEFFYNQPINPVVHPQQQQQQQQQQQMYENLQVNNNVDNNNMQSDGLVDFSIDDVSDLHELMDESSSFSTGDNKQDGSYYF